MQLNKFNSKNVPSSARGSAATITFSKTGAVLLNQKAAEIINLQEGSTVGLAQDENEPANWYIYKDPEGFFFKTT